MGIDSIIFLLFLGCVAVAQRFLPKPGRVLALLCASLAFYALASLNYLVLLLLLCLLNYWAAAGLSREGHERQRTLIFAVTVAINLAVLILFKYATGFIGQALAAMGWHTGSGGVSRIAAPLGLSYFTFQMLACVTDAYRRTWKLENGFANFVLFGFFFPQISSGPIPRADRLLPQLSSGGHPTAEDRLAGLRLIAYGFFKKFVVANGLSNYVTTIFTDPPINSMPVLIACCFNALQLYADFSGYVDIALGSARFLGVRLDPNFDRPFVSTSVTEFWRRWHITLATWLRDYLYMPLVIRIRNLGKPGILLAMIFTFAICGIWHAATWPFLLFGIAQGVALAAEILTKSWRTKRLKPIPKPVIARAGNFYTLSFFVLSQVLFRSVDLTQAGRIYSRLLHVHLGGGVNSLLGVGPYIFSFCVIPVGLWAGVQYAFAKTPERWVPWFVLLCATLILILGRQGSAPFIYAAF